MALGQGHKKHVVHRAIKLSNIFEIAVGSIRLGNFGIGRSEAATIKRGATKRGASRLAFTCPDVLAGGEFSIKSDIWSCGILCVYLLTGSFPFKTRDEILAEPVPPLPGVSPSFQNLICQMLEKDPAKRPMAREVELGPAIYPAGPQSYNGQVHRNWSVVWRDPQMRSHAGDHLRALQEHFSGHNLDFFSAQKPARTPWR
jgi:serine/threonine protein kinase